MSESTQEFIGKVSGMSCSHCVRAVKEALMGVAGVVSAEVDLDSGSAKVQYGGEATTAAMIAAVAEEGYALTEA